MFIGLKPSNTAWTLRARTNWFGSITGRIGWSLDHALVYWRGGFAAADNKFEIENTAINLGQPSKTRDGFVLGSGIEWAFGPCWSTFLEADFYDFSGQNVFFPGNLNPIVRNPPFTVHTSQTIETLKFGVNYRFWSDRGLVVAQY